MELNLWTVGNRFSAKKLEEQFANHITDQIVLKGSRVGVIAIRFSKPAESSEEIQLHSDLTSGQVLGGLVEPILTIFCVEKGSSVAILRGETVYQPLVHKNPKSATFALVGTILYIAQFRNYSILKFSEI